VGFPVVIPMIVIVNPVITCMVVIMDLRVREMVVGV